MGRFDEGGHDVIVVDKAKLKFLLAGRQIEVDVPREYRKGRSYAVGTSHKRSVCRAEIVDRERLEDGWRLKIKLSSDEKPRLLSANPAAQRADYTSDPRKAAVGEPEALTDAQLRHLTRFRSSQLHAARTAPILDLRDRMLAELDEAMRSTPSRDDKAKLRAAKHHLSRLGKAS